MSDVLNVQSAQYSSIRHLPFLSGRIFTTGFCPPRHQGIPYIVFHLGCQLYAVNKRFSNRVCSTYPCRDRVSLLYSSRTFSVSTVLGRPHFRGEHEIEYFTFVIDDQVQFETED